MSHDLARELTPLLTRWLDGDAQALRSAMEASAAALPLQLAVDYHGIPLGHAAGTEHLTGAMQEHFGSFAPWTGEAAVDVIHVHLPAPLLPWTELEARRTGKLDVMFPAFGPDARLQTLLLEGGHLLAEDTGTLIVVSRAERRVMLCTVEGENLASGIYSPLQTAPSFRSRLSMDAILLTVLQELLACFDGMLIHAACVERGGRGVLIMAPECRGKSTTTFSLVQAGWRMLSDDRTLLRETADGLRLQSFPELSRIGRRSLAFFPELEGRVEMPRGEGKAEFDVASIWGDVRTPTAEPALLVMPRVCEAPLPFADRVRRLDGFADVNELMADNLLRTSPEATRTRFELITTLFGEVPMVELMVGPGVDQTAEHLHRLMKDVAG